MNTITATAWNKLVDFLRRHQLLGCTTLTNGTWKHPWQVDVTWNTETKTWQARVVPGFVNGQDVTVSVEVIKSGQRQWQDIPLTDDPAFPLTVFRALGSDADPDNILTSDTGDTTLTFEPVPEFFNALGVGSRASLSMNADTGFVTNSGEATSKRKLRACDLVLHHDRPATTSSWITGTGFDGTFASFAVGTKQRANARPHAYLRTTKRFEEAAPPDPLQQLKGLWEDTDHDSLLIATVYLFSPEGSTSDTVDEHWTPYVKHHAFWNLLYTHNRQDTPLNANPLILNTGLAAGLLDQIGNQMLAQVNDATQAAYQFLSNNRIEGRFWSI
jgi:hypothetical protein